MEYQVAKKSTTTTFPDEIALVHVGFGRVRNIDEALDSLGRSVRVELG